MKKLIFFVASCLAAQTPTCDHPTKYAPVGAVTVFRNGVRQKEGTDYALLTVPGTQRCCLVHPLSFGDGDGWSVLIARAIAMTMTVSGQPVSYTAYVPWVTDWNCVGSVGASNQLVLKVDPIVFPGLQHSVDAAGKERYLVDWSPTTKKK